MFKCHCHAKATWVVDAFSTHNAFTTFSSGKYVKDAKHSRWAACDEHLAYACRENKLRVDGDGSFVTVRPVKR